MDDSDRAVCCRAVADHAGSRGRNAAGARCCCAATLGRVPGTDGVRPIRLPDRKASMPPSPTKTLEFVTTRSGRICSTATVCRSRLYSKRAAAWGRATSRKLRCLVPRGTPNNGPFKVKLYHLDRQAVLRVRSLRAKCSFTIRSSICRNSWGGREALNPGRRRWFLAVATLS